MSFTFVDDRGKTIHLTEEVQHVALTKHPEAAGFVELIGETLQPLTLSRRVKQTAE